MRVVLDTNVLVSALKSDMGASFALISRLPSEKFQIALSVPLYLEYQDVLTRDENMSGGSTQKEIFGFLRYLCSISYKQDVFFLWRPFLKDPKDDMILEAAVASNSKYIVTHNLKDFRGVERFGIDAIKPADFLKKLKETNNEYING
ncbi:MAG: putative toxin-antitoxin system toxin component, PIN family [Candidatus Aminicenantes bacterium]|nr:putative toxin-antitoxin system toxin component, PIN family [Candidatus Aminicenantes bacterium]NIM84159.1 putative toxin-antitoxin system toxin component, PIN family [Candidatus Aminicenantes bacterium]NIN23606.1 putative toxin-antitoxin system toxin component, PIN family [Candidatus Aminicenantes bacterium]NIN47313.1 putative toxin-antitoxin system toxin component, PIN family [Candidatus Aminicenantes bacterium]NIN90242.1 putative toxin-antitoxin system toxin component, PIN family [Candida